MCFCNVYVLKINIIGQCFSLCDILKVLSPEWFYQSLENCNRSNTIEICSTCWIFYLQNRKVNTCLSRFQFMFVSGNFKCYST